MPKKNNTPNYFPHDSNARNSDKMIRLRMTHKAAGYGVYFMILERLREEPSYMSVKDYNMIAFDLRVDTALVKSVIEDFGLFVVTPDGNYFYSESFNERMTVKDEKSRRRAEAGREGMRKRYGSPENTENLTKLPQNGNNVITKPPKEGSNDITKQPQNGNNVITKPHKDGNNDITKLPKEDNNKRKEEERKENIYNPPLYNSPPLKNHAETEPPKPLPPATVAHITLATFRQQVTERPYTNVINEELRRGLGLGTDTATLEKWLDEYIDTQTATGNTRNTFNEYRKHFANWARIKKQSTHETNEEPRPRYYKPL